MKQAYSLLEISIVLLAIGLIVAGIITGINILEASNSLSTIKQMQKYDSAVRVFTDLYGGELPGDYRRGTAIGSTESGDGNKEICINSGSCLYPNRIDNAGPGTNELASFFEHLSLVGLAPEEFDGNKTLVELGVNFPKLKLDVGLLGYTSESDGLNYWLLGVVDTPDAFLLIERSLSSKQAHAIDIQLDDGIPGFGLITEIDPLNIDSASGLDPGGGYFCHSGGAASNTSTDITYDLSSNEKACTLRYKMTTQ